MAVKLAVKGSIMLVALMAVCLVDEVKSEPDTRVVSLVCNVNSYGKDDPFGYSVDYVLADLMNVTPSQNYYFYYTVSPYPTHIAYGHATCNTRLANSECANCLATARGTVSSSCSGRIGGQVNMVDCAMRYENYGFV